MAGVINTAISVIFLGPGLQLNGSTLSVIGTSSVRPTTNSATSIQLTNAQYYVGYTGTGGHTFTLIDASTNAGVEFVIKNRGSGNLIIDATAYGGLWGTTGVNTRTLIVGEAIHLISDGTNWIIVGFASGIIT